MGEGVGKKRGVGGEEVGIFKIYIRVLVHDCFSLVYSHSSILAVLRTRYNARPRALG